MTSFFPSHQNYYRATFVFGATVVSPVRTTHESSVNLMFFRHMNLFYTCGSGLISHFANLIVLPLKFSTNSNAFSFVNQLPQVHEKFVAVLPTILPVHFGHLATHTRTHTTVRTRKNVSSKTKCECKFFGFFRKVLVHDRSTETNRPMKTGALGNCDAYQRH
jgi:hypothetical protein